MRPDAQGLEGLPAVVIELAEEFQALQSQIVHEAAQKVQREVQRVADQKHHDEHDAGNRGHAVCRGHGRDGVEHLGHNAARQHQRHDTRIAQHVAEPAGQGVVGAGEGGRELAEARRAAGGAGKQHHNAHHENREAHSM